MCVAGETRKKREYADKGHTSRGAKNVYLHDQFGKISNLNTANQFFEIVCLISDTNESMQYKKLVTEEIDGRARGLHDMGL